MASAPAWATPYVACSLLQTHKQQPLQLQLVHYDFTQLLQATGAAAHDVASNAITALSVHQNA